MTVIGVEPCRFEVVEDWGSLTNDTSEVPGLAINSDRRIHAFCRIRSKVKASPSLSRKPPTGAVVRVLTPNGHAVSTWRRKEIIRAHGICIDKLDRLWLVDDNGHKVLCYDKNCEPLSYLGPNGDPSATGFDGNHFRSIKKCAGPYNCPTGIELDESCDFAFVTDGYGNSRVHRFDLQDNRLDKSWGIPGNGQKCFLIPHGIKRHPTSGELWICDRENSRIQVFNPDGRFLRQITELARPNNLDFDEQGYIYVIEQGFDTGMYPGEVSREPHCHSRLTVLKPNGEVLFSTENGLFYGGHGICVDRKKGDVYISEVRPESRSGVDSENFPLMRKLERIC